MTSPNPTLSTENISLNNNPFVWGNIALMAGVPWLLALSMAGLAVGDPVFPAWFEILLLGFPAIALTTWLQWQQPISPFSLWFVAKPNESLSDRDRQMLTLIKQHRNGWYTTGWIAAAVAILMSVIFCKIYLSAPLAQAIAPFPAGLRLFGILWAEIFFVLSSILMQSGISALRIKFTAESELIGLQPFAIEKIKNSFTTIGWRSPQLLKFFEEESKTNNLVNNNLDDDSEVKFEVTETLEPNGTISEPAPEQIVETEASAIAAEDSLIEPVLEPIEPSLDEEVIQESEELNSCELIEEIQEIQEIELEVVSDVVISIVDSEIAETEIEVILELEIEQILVATTSKTPEIDNKIVEELSELEPSELEPSEIISEKPVVEVSINTSQIADKKDIDFLLKHRRTGSSQKKNGFGKPIKHDNTTAVFTPEAIETDITKEPEQPAIALIQTEQKLEVPESESQDSDDELDELIAFNVYVENILQDYLENDDENSIELETQVPEDSTEDMSSKDQATNDQAANDPKDSKYDPKYDPKYLVQEFLVDKFLARLEELNVADKANRATIEQTMENSSEPNSEVDEFADLEALLDGNSLPENLE